MVLLRRLFFVIGVLSAIILPSIAAKAVDDSTSEAEYKKFRAADEVVQCFSELKQQVRFIQRLEDLEAKYFFDGDCYAKIGWRLGYFHGKTEHIKGDEVRNFFEALGYTYTHSPPSVRHDWDHPAKDPVERQKQVVAAFAKKYGYGVTRDGKGIIPHSAAENDRGKTVANFNAVCSTRLKYVNEVAAITKGDDQQLKNKLKEAREGNTLKFLVVKRVGENNTIIEDLYEISQSNRYKTAPARSGVGMGAQEYTPTPAKEERADWRGATTKCINAANELSKNAEERVRAAQKATFAKQTAAGVGVLSEVICGGTVGRDRAECQEKLVRNWGECSAPIETGSATGARVPPSVSRAKQCMWSKYPNKRGVIDGKLIEKALAAGKAIPEVAAEASGEPAGTAGAGEDELPQCAVENLGWIICPAMTFIAGLSDGAHAIISEFLAVQPKILETSGGNGTYEGWKIFRNIANIVFIVIFLAVIASQVSSVGISNYGIKRIMPRLIVGAILINASFLIARLAVDLSNIAGHSIYTMLDGMGGAVIANTTQEAGAGHIVGLILSGSVTIAVAGAAAVLAAIAIGLPGILMFLLAMVVTMLVLIGRQAAVIMLIVISPLAFASWILPNTESWFKKWQKALLGLLLVFPTVSLLFGAGAFASRVLNSTGGDFHIQIAALVVSALPLIATPSLLKGSMNALGTIGAKFGNLGSSTMASLNKKRVEAAGQKRANYMARARNSFMKQDFSGQGKPGGIIRRTGRAFARGGQKILRHSDQVKRDRKLQTDLLQSDRDQQYKQGLMADHAAGNLKERLGSAVDTAAGKGMMEKLRSEAIGNVEATLKSSSISELRNALKQAIASNDSTTAIAAQNQLLKRGSAGISSFEDTMLDYERGGGPMSGEMRQSLATNIRESHAGTMDKNLAVGEWAIGDESMENSRTAAHDKLAANGMTIEKFSALTERSQIELLTSGKAVLSQKQLNNLSYPRGAMAEKVSPAVSAAAKGAAPKP
ncbi:MAG: hypothetical protein Q4A34_02660 [Candidatus Saccharibacteria bacterium]|nr:hypothetical protein [Candidatus Saccharibacteria bacterium]